MLRHRTAESEFSAAALPHRYAAEETTNADRERLFVLRESGGAALAALAVEARTGLVVTATHPPHSDRGRTLLEYAAAHGVEPDQSWMMDLVDTVPLGHRTADDYDEEAYRGDSDYHGPLNGPARLPDVQYKRTGGDDYEDGVMVAYVVEHGEEREVGYLDWDYDGVIGVAQVHPEYQGEGIGLAMLDEARLRMGRPDLSHSHQLSLKGRNFALADAGTPRDDDGSGVMTWDDIWHTQPFNLEGGEWGMHRDFIPRGAPAGTPPQPIADESSADFTHKLREKYLSEGEHKGDFGWRWEEHGSAESWEAHNPFGYDEHGEYVGEEFGGFNEEGRDKDGFDVDGYDEDGYDHHGYDDDGLDRDGLDRYGHPWPAGPQEGARTLTDRLLDEPDHFQEMLDAYYADEGVEAYAPLDPERTPRFGYGDQVYTDVEEAVAAASEAGFPSLRRTRVNPDHVILDPEDPEGRRMVYQPDEWASRDDTAYLPEQMLSPTVESLGEHWSPAEDGTGLTYAPPGAGSASLQLSPTGRWRASGTPQGGSPFENSFPTQGEAAEFLRGRLVSNDLADIAGRLGEGWRVDDEGQGIWYDLGGSPGLLRRTPSGRKWQGVVPTDDPEMPFRPRTMPSPTPDRAADMLMRRLGPAPEMPEVPDAPAMPVTAAGGAKVNPGPGPVYRGLYVDYLDWADMQELSDWARSNAEQNFPLSEINPDVIDRVLRGAEERGLGRHWSTDPEVSKDFARKGWQFNEKMKSENLGAILDNDMLDDFFESAGEEFDGENPIHVEHMHNLMNEMGYDYGDYEPDGVPIVFRGLWDGTGFDDTVMLPGFDGEVRPSNIKHEKEVTLAPGTNVDLLGISLLDDYEGVYGDSAVDSSSLSPYDIPVPGYRVTATRTGGRIHKADYDNIFQEVMFPELGTGRPQPGGKEYFEQRNRRDKAQTNPGPSQIYRGLYLDSLSESDTQYLRSWARDNATSPDAPLSQIDPRVYEEILQHITELDSDGRDGLGVGRHWSTDPNIAIQFARDGHKYNHDAVSPADVYTVDDIDQHMIDEWYEQEFEYHYGEPYFWGDDEHDEYMENVLKVNEPFPYDEYLADLQDSMGGWSNASTNPVSIVLRGDWGGEGFDDTVQLPGYDGEMRPSNIPSEKEVTLKPGSGVKLRGISVLPALDDAFGDDLNWYDIPMPDFPIFANRSGAVIRVAADSAPVERRYAGLAPAEREPARRFAARARYADLTEDIPPVPGNGQVSFHPSLFDEGPLSRPGLPSPKVDPGPTTLYRGLNLEGLTAEERDRLREWAVSNSEGDGALLSETDPEIYDKILDQVSGGFGRHWTTNPSVAEAFAQQGWRFDHSRDDPWVPRREDEDWSTDEERWERYTSDPSGPAAFDEWFGSMMGISPDEMPDGRAAVEPMERDFATRQWWDSVRERPEVGQYLPVVMRADWDGTGFDWGDAQPGFDGATRSSEIPQEDEVTLLPGTPLSLRGISLLDPLREHEFVNRPKDFEPTQWGAGGISRHDIPLPDLKITAASVGPDSPEWVDLPEGVIPDTGGRWEFEHAEFRPGGWAGTGRHEYGVIPANAPAVMEDKFGRPHYYDPDRVSLIEDDLGRLTSGSPRTSIADYDLPEGLLWRGMSDEEFQEARERGYFQSRGGWNFEDQQGKTYFSTRPGQAAGYASDYAPWVHAPGFGRPGHLVAVPDRPEVEREMETEVGVPGQVPFDEVQYHFEGHPTFATPGMIQWSNEGGDWSEGSRMVHPAQVTWEPSSLGIGRAAAQNAPGGAYASLPTDTPRGRKKAAYDQICADNKEMA